MSTDALSTSIIPAPPASPASPELAKRKASRSDSSPMKVLMQLRKAALIAIALRLIIGLLKSIAKGKLTSKTLWAIRDELLGTDPWKWAVVFGGWAAFKPLTRLIESGAIAAFGKEHKEAAAQAATIAAGTIVSQSIRVMLVSTRVELGLYLLSRASHSVATAFIMPRLPQLLQNFNHWDVFFVSLSGYQILYALLFYPGSHLQSYRQFLINCVMTPQEAWDTVASFHRGRLVPNVLHAFDMRGIKPYPTDTSNMQNVCRVLHPHTTSCDVNVFTWVLRHMVKFSIPLYLPLKTITTLGFGWKKVKRAPLQALIKVIKSVLQSSLFLSLYCGGPMRVVCGFNQLGIRNPWLMGMMAGMACGLPTLLEPKSRRLDLALYCNMQAFRSLIMMLVDKGWLSRPNRHHVMVMYTIALTTLLHFFRFRPQELHPNVRFTLKHIVGEFPENLTFANDAKKSADGADAALPRTE